MVYIFDSACELLPLWTVAPLPSLWPHPLPLPKLHKCTVYTVQTVCGLGGGGVGEGGMLSCVLDHMLQEFNTLFLTRLRTYTILLHHPKQKWPVKTTFRGLVSLKFLRPWIGGCFPWSKWLIDTPPPLMKIKTIGSTYMVAAGLTPGQISRKEVSTEQKKWQKKIREITVRVSYSVKYSTCQKISWRSYIKNYENWG